MKDVKAPSLDFVLNEFCHLLVSGMKDENDKIYVIAHNGKSVEQKIIPYWCQKTLSQNTLKFLQHVVWIDSMRLVKSISNSKQYSVDFMLGKHGFSEQHRALNDCLALYYVLLKEFTNLEKILVELGVSNVIIILCSTILNVNFCTH